MSFTGLIGDALADILQTQGIIEPTEIQMQAIGHIQEGKDVIGVAKTGTGKTLAYLLPIVQKLSPDIKTPQAFIITPTHELAAQVHKVADALCKDYGGAALIIGGANMQRQLQRLKEKPSIIIGSAGRMLEMITMKKLKAHTVTTIVLDEADRLLDVQNKKAVDDLIHTTLRDRQLLFFSASMSQAAIETATAMAKEPVIVRVTEAQRLPDTLSHLLFTCEQRDKTEILRKIVASANIERGIVFLNAADKNDQMVKRLIHHGITAVGLLGETYPHQRRQALLDFREGRARLLVASDLAARGLDISGVDYVINIDVPEDPTFYLHRAGRTGRMNRAGTVITISTTRELVFVKQIEKKLKIDMDERKMEKGNMKKA